MVNARRPDPIICREIPLRDSGVRRREILRQRLLRDRPSVVRRSFVDRDEIPIGIITSVENRENIPANLSFAPNSTLTPTISRVLKSYQLGRNLEKDLK